MDPRIEKLASRWLARQKKAGADSFMNYGRGTDAKAVFRDLLSDAKYESGHGGYSGTIAEKSSFVMRSSTPMTMTEAQQFIHKDIERNDKWGPAFAVPVASIKIEDSKEYTVQVKARDQRTAAELGKEAIAAKGRAKAGTTIEVEIVPGGLKMLKPGGVPSFEFTADKKTYFDSGATLYGTKHNSKKEAVEAAKQELAQPRWEVGSKLQLKQVVVLGTITKTSEASKLPTWEVTAARKQVSKGKIEGYYFYGIASS